MKPRIVEIVENAAWVVVTIAAVGVLIWVFKWILANRPEAIQFP
jgi:hypothetical protein